MTSRAFITGISGFVGRALAHRLLDKQITVSGLARSHADVAGCRLLTGEIVHPSAYATEASRAQIVIHLAAPTLASEINANPIEALKVNWRGTANILDCFRAGEGEHFVLVSTGKVYGRCQTLPVSEDHPLNPETVLGKAKKAAEDLVRFYADHTDKRFTILRLFNAYGPGQKPGFLVPAILEQIGKAKIELGDIKGRRDFIFIDDVVEAILTVLFNFRDPGGKQPPLAQSVRTFNVGSGQSTSPAEIVACLEEITGRSLTIVVDEKRMRTGEPDEERADVTKLKALGWEPRVSLREGLERAWRASTDV